MEVKALPNCGSQPRGCRSIETLCSGTAGVVSVVAEVKKIASGGSHYAVETTEVPPVVKQSFKALRPLGTAAIVGITPEVNLDVHNDLMAEGKSMIGVIEGDSIPRVFIQQLIAYYKAGLFPFDKVIKFYEFEQINQAFEDLASGVSIKSILKPG
jgi:aryl-alcohol dehydrogenase